MRSPRPSWSSTGCRSKKRGGDVFMKKQLKRLVDYLASKKLGMMGFDT